METTYADWLFFFALMFAALFFDLYRFYRNPHAVSMKEASYASIGWILLALVFNGWIYLEFGSEPATQFFTGYLLEKSLSVDNLFIFLLLFSQFKVPEASKHQVLFYGILGAIIMRGLLIWGGIVLIEHFSWMFIIFGFFLIFTGIGLIVKKETDFKPQNSWIYRWANKIIPFTPSYEGNSFFVKKDGKRLATPLFSLLIIVELTDFIFALDSVPAILGITTDPFIVFTSNIFAILGLRALFFVLEGMMQSFHLLHYALAFILTFIGIKMVFIQWIHIPTWLTLLLLCSALAIATISSIIWPRTSTKK